MAAADGDRQRADIAIRQQVLLESLKAAEIQKFGPFLKQIEKEIRDQLSGDELTALSRTRLEAQLREVDAVLSAIYAGYTDQLQGDLFDIADHQAGAEVKVLDAFSVADYQAAALTVDKLRRVVDATPLSVTGADGGKLFADVVKNWTQSEIDAVTGTLRNGYFLGQTNQQIVQAIRGTRALNYSDGLLNTTSRNAEAIVRTGVQHIANAARFAVWQQNADLVTGYQWISTLDSRTTPICRSLDHRIFKIGEGPLPPAHWGCRSTTVSVIEGDLAKFSTTRASSEGPVSADLSYYDWLKTQSPEFQDEVLGKARGQLFRDGGLSTERFAALQLNRNFRPMTLDQIKALEPLAFKRAGLD